MTRLLLISGLICLSGFVASTCAQDYTFYFNTDSGDYAGGSGHGTAEIDISISNNTLTAIIRNTSPDAENYGSGNGYLSPAIIEWGFELQTNSGASVSLNPRSPWGLTGFIGTGTNETEKLPSWSQQIGVFGSGVDPPQPYSQTGNVFSFSPGRNGDGQYDPSATGGDGLYNREATGGLQASLDHRNFFTGISAEEEDAKTRAEFSATFSTPDGSLIDLVETTDVSFTPFVRFGYVGSADNPQILNTFGTPPEDEVVAGHSPEPSSLLIWALGIALCVGVNRRRRRIQPVRSKNSASQ